MKTRTKTLLGGAVTAMAAVALIPTAAHAVSQNGVVTVCNWSNSPAYGEFPYRGGMETTLINANSCWTHSGFTGLSSDEVVGYRYVNGVWQAVAYQYFNDANGTNFVF